ncbi:MAG: ATP-binding protein [Gammaproteobacteria bacterium]|nr:ATP-binding protein [Gammaproteobacteria bacterium]
MRLVTGSAVTGEDFFGREIELDHLLQKVINGDHILLTGQRRMGKTSLARELGRQLEERDWVSIYVDVEGASSIKDLIRKIGHAIFQIEPKAKQVLRSIGKTIQRIEKVEAFDFSLQLGELLDSGSWRELGSQLFEICRKHDKNVFLVIDELPILLSRFEKQNDSSEEIEMLLSWFRAELQMVQDTELVVLFSGSIGLVPLVTRLGISDRINHLYQFRLGPWNEKTCIQCLKCLSESYELPLDENVLQAMVDRLGIGIPSHIQLFFDRIRIHMLMNDLIRVTESDIDLVYSKDLLGPPSSKDLYHFESRLSDALNDQTYEIAMKILTEAAVRDVFSDRSKRALISMYEKVTESSVEKVAWALDTLEQDEYLERDGSGYVFKSKLLKDWWTVRFEHSYKPLNDSHG